MSLDPLQDELDLDGTRRVPRLGLDYEPRRDDHQYGQVGEKAPHQRHIVRSHFWEELMDDVFGARSGGSIIFVDAEHARKGIAKTSCAVAVARLIANAFDYQLQENDLTLAGSEYLRRYREHPGADQPSVLVLDEFVGGGAGDSRKAMTHENVDFGRAWQLLRTKRVVTLATLPDWSEADPRLQKYADYRLWCQEQPMGCFQAYKITVPFDGGGLETLAMGHGSDTTRIFFPNMDAHADPFYRHISKRKDELINADNWNANQLHADDEDEEPPDPKEIRRNEQIRIAVRLYEPWDEENHRMSYNEVGNVVGKSESWAGNVIRDWRNGDYRDLVPNPTADD